MIVALLLSSLLGAAPDVGAVITEARRTFIDDGDDRVSATPTHRVISHADGSLELQGAQPLRLSLQSVRREGAAPCRTETKRRAVDPASPRTVRTTRACALEETWTNGPDGLAQTFTLARPPRGTGALTLFLSVVGPWHHQDQGGHVFRGPGAADSLRYGNAFVVRGERKSPLVVRHVEGGLELVVPKEVVDAPQAFPLHIDPLVSAEVPLDPDAVTLDAPPTDEHSPAIATNSLGEAMVVWVDDRRQRGTDLFGARLTLSGTVRDATGLPVSVEPGNQVGPTLCGEGTGWLIAWASEVNGGSEVHAVRVNNLGLLATPFVVAEGAQPALAAKGTSAQSYLAYVNPTGALEVVELSGTSITSLATSTAPMGRASNPAIAGTESKWFAVFVSTLGTNPATIWGLTQENGVLVSTQVSSNLVVEASRPTVAMGVGPLGGVAPYVAWEQGTAVMSQSPGVNGPQSFSLASSPALVRTTSGTLLAPPTLGFFRSSALTLVDLNDGSLSSVPVSVRARELALAASGRLWAVWTENVLGGNGDVWMTSFAAGASPTPAVVAQAAPTQRQPHVAFPNGSLDGVAVWLEGDRVIRGARVQLQNDGRVSLGGSFLIADPIVPVLALDLASSGTGPDFLVVWTLAGGAVQGIQTYTDAPSTGGAIPFSIQGATSPPAIAWEDQNGLWVVAWGTGTEAVARTLTPGAFPTALRTLASAAASPHVELSCLRGKCLFALETAAGGQAGLFGASSGSTGSIFSFTGAQPVVTHDGTAWVVGWRAPAGFGFAQVDPSTTVFTTLGPLNQPTGLRFSQLSLAPGTPPVLAYVENDGDGGAAIVIDRVGLPGQRAFLAHGLMPSLGTQGTLPDARGTVVYQRYDAEPGVQAIRAWGTGFAFPAPPDAGVDAGVDAGTDAGVDAGSSDAGETPGELPDAGVIIFRTTGCTCQSLDAAPLGLALSWLLRRRRERR